MKKNAILTFVIFIITVFLLAIHSIKVSENLNTLKESIKERIVITNSIWTIENDSNSFFGEFSFNDLSNIEEITISYKDEMLFDIDVTKSSFSLNKDENKANFSYAYSFVRPCFAQLEVTYIDGRSETIITRITLG